MKVALIVLKGMPIGEAIIGEVVEENEKEIVMTRTFGIRDTESNKIHSINPLIPPMTNINIRIKKDDLLVYDDSDHVKNVYLKVKAVFLKNVVSIIGNKQ